MTELEIEKIVQEVLKQFLQEKQDSPKLRAKEKMLVVYSGAMIGFEESLKSLKRLAGKGYVFDVFLSRGAQEALAVTKLQDKLVAQLAPERLITPCDACSPESLAREYETVIVPALSVNTAAKLSQCMTDAPVTRLLFTALAMGKQVFFATDGCCPDCKAREELGYAMNDAMKAKLRSNLAALKSYGGHLAAAKELGETVLRVKEPQSAPAAASAGGSVRRSVIGRKQMDDCPVGSTLTIAKDSIVTALAQDIAEERSIKIVRV